MKKGYDGFWLGQSWVSRCKRCGNICFTVAQEVEHDKEKCRKEKLRPLLPHETENPPGSEGPR